MENFDMDSVTPGFCPACGSILPNIKPHGNIVCYTCKSEYKPEIFGSNEVEYKIIFNTYEPKSVKVKQEKDDEEGPAIERLCKNCGHNKMTYAALQLRSADEGQTVFFTCVKCKFKESENS